MVTLRSSRKGIGSKDPVPLSLLGRKGVFLSTDRGNPTGVVYIKGDEFTDGSLRFVPTPFSVDTHHVTLQVRENGIWRSGGLNLSTRSLLLGLDLAIEAQGNLLNIASVESATKELTVASEFDDSGSKPAKVAILGTRINRVVVVSDTENELVTKSHVDEFVASERTQLSDAFRYKFYFKTGSVAATSSVTLTISKGTIAEAGPLFFRTEMPASQWPANTEVEVELQGGVNITPGNSFTTSLFSDNDFSLLGLNPNGGGTTFDNFFAFDVQPFNLQTIISTPDGTDRFLTESLTAMFIADNSGNPVLEGEQVTVG